MRKAYEQLEKIITEFDGDGDRAVSMTFHVCKLVEENGEMAQSINKLNGRKKRGKESNEEIVDNIEEEVADSIQCLMAIAINAGVKYESLKARLEKKNKKFETGIEEKKKK